MALTWRFKFTAFAIAASVIIGGAYRIGDRLANTAAQDASARQLQIISLDLESILERYEALPFALSFQPEAAQVLQQPDGAAVVLHLNRVLSAIQQQAKVAAIYLMDPQGKTLASSNWDTSQSYIGKNLSLAKEAYALEAAKPEIAKQKNSDGTVSTYRNMAKFNEKMKPLQAEVDNHQNNIELLQKELNGMR